MSGNAHRAGRLVVLGLLGGLVGVLSARADGGKMVCVATWGRTEAVERGDVRSLAFLGKTGCVLFATEDEARYAEVVHSTECRTLFHAPGRLAAVALSPDSRRIVVAPLASDPPDRRIWRRRGRPAPEEVAPVDTLCLIDVESTRVVGDLPAIEQPLVLAWSPSGEQVLAVARDGVFVLADVRAGKCSDMSDPTGDVTGAGFTDEGATVYVAGRTGHVQLYAADTRKPTETLEIHGDATAVALSRDGKKVAVAYGKRLVVRDRATNDAAWHVDLREPLIALALSHDGKIACGATASRELRRFVVGESDRDEIHRHVGTVTAIAVSRDGRRALSTGADGTLRLWDVTSGQHVRRVRCSETIGPVAYASDGAALVAVRSGVELVDPERDSVTRAVTGVGPRIAVSFTEDETQLAGVGAKRVAFWPREKGPARLFDCSGPVRALGGHRVLALAVGEDRQWRFALRDLDAGTARTATTAVSGWPNAVATSPDGKLALVAASELEVWDLEDLSRRAVFENCPATTGVIAVSPDARLGAVMHGDGSLRLWTLAGGWALDTLDMRDLGSPSAIAFDPKGEWLLVGTTDGRIHRIALPATR